MTSAPTRTVAPLGTANEIAPDHYAFEQPDGGWCLNNAGFVCGPERTVIIDVAATEKRTRALLDAVAAVAPSAPQVVVNTHFHGDHTLGNCFVSATTPVVAHARAGERMREAGLDLVSRWPEVEWGAVGVRLPDIEVDAAVTVLRTGSAAAAPIVELHHLGPAHTDNDLIAWCPHERILFAGDQVMAGCTPFALFGSITGSLDAAHQLRLMEPHIVVPGHGPAGGLELIDETLRYLEWVLDIARAGRRRGLTPGDVARAQLPGPFPTWSEPERLVANVYRAFADLDGTEPASQLDLTTIFADMTAVGGAAVCRA